MHQTFEVYVHDTRYSVPTLVLVSASSELRARARGRELLLESPFHLQVDVDLNGVRLFSVCRPNRKMLPDPSESDLSRPSSS